jgi:alkylhydroperoxidase family enzyme
MPRITIPDKYVDAPLSFVVQHMAPEMTNALYNLSKAAYQHSILSLREFEGARTRIAQINGCQICQKFRSFSDVPTYLEGFGEDASSAINTRGPAPNEEFYLNVADWQTSSVYSEREKIAIDFAERFSLSPDALGYDDVFWNRVKANFSEAELYDLTVSVAAFVATGRFVHVLGLDQTTCSLGDSLPKMAAAAE